MITEAVNARFTIGNIPGSALPSTGGPGTTPFRLLGLFLLSTAFWAVFALRKRSI